MNTPSDRATGSGSNTFRAADVSIFQVIAPLLAMNVVATCRAVRPDTMLEQIRQLPDNKADITAVNILHCLQDESWTAVRKYTNAEFFKYEAQRIVTDPQYRGGLGAKAALDKLKEYPAFKDVWEGWTKTDKYRRCMAIGNRLWSAPMAADDPGHACRKRCQCNLVYHYANSTRDRIGHEQMISLRFDYLDEHWVLTDEYHRDYERFEIEKQIYPADMAIIKASWSSCK